MSRYVVAVRREARGQASLADMMSEVAGVVINPTSPDRALIDVSPQVAEEIERRFGDTVIIEPEVPHNTN
jgi:hypothetical protein